MGCLNSKEKKPADSAAASGGGGGGLAKMDSYEQLNATGNTPPSTPAPPAKSAKKPPSLAKRREKLMNEVPREILKERAILRNIDSQTISRFVGDLNGIDIAVDGLVDSQLLVFDITAQVQIDEAKNSTILIGPCDGSVFIRNCNDCTMFIAASQLRTRDCENCTIYLYCPTEPVIEMSHGMKIGSWNVAYPGLQRLFDELDFDPLENKCYQIHDFTPNHESLPPVHWHRVSDADIRDAQREYNPEQGEPYDGEEPVNPVPIPTSPMGIAEERDQVEKENSEQEALNSAVPIDENAIDIEFED